MENPETLAVMEETANTVHLTVALFYILICILPYPAAAILSIGVLPIAQEDALKHTNLRLDDSRPKKKKNLIQCHGSHMVAEQYSIQKDHIAVKIIIVTHKEETPYSVVHILFFFNQID